MSETKLKKSKRLRGFAATLGNRLELVKEMDEFKEFSKDISIKLLMNPLDGKYAALITIDKGTLNIEGIRNDDPSNLKKKKLGWNGKMAMKLQLFLELASGKISQGKLLGMVAIGKIKVRGLVYFVILQKLFSFLPDSEESKPKYLENRTKPFIAAKLFFFSGLLHIAIGILAFGLVSVPLTAFLFAFFVIWLSIWFNRLVKANVMNDTEILISITIITILNSMNYLIFILEGVTEGRFFLNILMYIVLSLNLINFLIFFSTKSKLNSMDMDEKLNYFSILLMRGLGMNFFFRFLDFIRAPDPHYLIAIFCIILGTCIIIYGNKVMNKEDRKVQIIALILLCLSIIYSLLIYMFIVLALCMLFNIVLFSVVVLIRFYYIIKKF
ncbi:MAG: hypothetical protein EU529_05175 [Promethearchaeota archaeon]|nr:MAG: hypothetical protein EU529_05175 [Candidatus Lokiarchaeota archaeon]